MLYRYYLFIYLLHGLYRALSHSQSEESQVRGGHKSVSEKPAVKFSFQTRRECSKADGQIWDDWLR